MTAEGETRVPGEVQPAAELLPAVYAELRRLAAVLTGRLPPGQTLQPTALVHEAYMKLVRNQDRGLPIPLLGLHDAWTKQPPPPACATFRHTAARCPSGPPPRPCQHPSQGIHRGLERLP